MATAFPVLPAELALIASGADAIISGSFIFAALLFFTFWGARRMRGKSKLQEPLELTHSATTTPKSGPEFPPVDATTVSASTPDIYKGPAASPLSVATEERQGIAQFLKVPVALYRPIDLPLIGLVFLIYFGLTAGGSGDDSKPLEEKFNAQVLIASIVFQLMLGLMVIAFIRWRSSIRDWLGLRWKQWPLALGIAPATVFLMWVLMIALNLIGWNAWLERSLGIESMQETVKLFKEAQSPLVLALMTVSAVVVAPIVEEVVFRGYLYPAAKKFCGPTGGILFSSLVFAAAHGNVVALLPLFILAVLLCLIYESTGSIWANISVHFLFNAATVTLQLLARSGIIDIPEPQ